MSVVQLVAEIARAAPNHTALEAAGTRLGYGALDARANRLAHHLLARGITRDVPVGICLPRSFDQIIAALAIMKAGGAFLPLDPSWPDARLIRVLDDSGAPVIIGRSALAAPGRVAIDVDDPARDANSGDPGIACDAESLAYVIYTSGSTGEPKGVEITHANLLNLVAWHQGCFATVRTDRASHVAGLGFDAAVWEVWPHLCAGATVVLADEAVRTSAALLQDWLVDHAITVAFVPTPLAEPMLAASWPDETMLRLLLTGGDTLHTRPRPGLPFAVWNNYGPTECTVVATACEVPPAGEGLPPIGAPIRRSQVHLLDADGRPVADGARGELFIGGANVGRGYRNRPDLTAQRFVPDPFGPPGGRLYRTGDLGTRRPDGTIAFHGRADDQEKIRGHRVEPDEVTAALDRHDEVGACAVVARGAGVDRRLVAYVVPAAGATPSAEALRDFLADRLPDYMVPAEFVRLDALPLTTSGKLDRAALPEPGPDNALATVAYREPETPTERRLAAIVAGLLGIERIGADDNFFLLGGHSLLGTQVVLRAREAFGVELSLRHLFEAETVASLATVIEDLLIETLSAMSDEEAALAAAK